ncbi:MAG: hypothetical protein LBR81_04585 [Prevotellaceae bacterium]|jgi:hypothetical protein|nr:hypothetical protein [Prevotellaceae bacterium]
MEKVRELEVSLPLQYEQIPAGIVLSEPLPQHINFKVRDVGINLLIYCFSSRNDTLHIRWNNRFANTKKEGLFNIEYKELEHSILENLQSSTVLLVEFKPHNINVRFDKLSDKMLPVQFAGTIKLSQQYVLSDKITLKPSQVKVYGSKMQLDTMKFLRTESLKINELSKTSKLKVKLDYPENIKVVPNEVELNIPVELFTEKTISVPVKGINIPSNMQLRTFPAHVDVSFFVGLSRFDSVNVNDFSLYLDYHNLVIDKTGRQKPQISASLPYISNLRLQPAEVEYILEEKR